MKAPSAKLTQTLMTAKTLTKDPSHAKILKWMYAAAFREYGTLDDALKAYAEALSPGPITEEVKKILEKAGKAKRAELFKNPTTPKAIKDLISNEKSKTGLVPLSSQLEGTGAITTSLQQDYATPPGSPKPHARPDDSLVLNDIKSGDIQAPQAPLALAEYALKLISEIYNVTAKPVKGENVKLVEEKKFADMVKLSIFKKFTMVTAKFKDVILSSLAKEDLICFFLNVRTCLA